MRNIVIQCGVSSSHKSNMQFCSKRNLDGGNPFLAQQWHCLEIELKHNKVSSVVCGQAWYRLLLKFKNHNQSLFPLRHVVCVALCALAFALLFSLSLQSVILVSHQHLNGVVLSIYCSSSSIYDRRHKNKCHGNNINSLVFTQIKKKNTRHWDTKLPGGKVVRSIALQRSNIFKTSHTLFYDLGHN